MKKVQALLVAICLFASAAAANALTFNYDTVITGGEPNGAPPWLKAEFTDSSISIGGTETFGVLLTLSATGLDFPSEFVSTWTFNTTLSSLADLDYMVLPTTTGTALKQNGAEFKLDDVGAGATGDHARYDIGFTFATSNSKRFQTYDLAAIFLYGPALLDSEMFNTANADGYLAEAHIQGITGGGEGSSWVVPGTTPVPEPGTMLLLGAGFLGLAIYGKRRKNS